MEKENNSNLFQPHIFFSEYVVGEKGKQHSKCRNSGIPKSNITGTLGCHGNGLYVPPCLILPFVKIPAKYVAACEKYNFEYTSTKSGWQDGESFMYYLEFVLLPHLKKQDVQFPVALFLDGHRSHLTLDVHRFSRDNDVIIVCLYPNSTRKLQPLDLVVNRSVKREFEKAKKNFYVDHEFLSLEDFPEVLSTTFRESLTPEHARSGFFSAGLFPYNFANMSTSDIFFRDRLKVF